MAEGYYNHFTGTTNATSAGVDPTTPPRYDHPTNEVIAVMNEESIDLSQKQVKLLTQNMIDSADVIYAMCTYEQSPEMLLNSEKTIFWKIADPFKMNIDGTREIRDLIKEKIQTLL